MFIVKEVQIDVEETPIFWDTVIVNNFFFQTKEEAKSKVRSLFENFVEEFDEEEFYDWLTKFKNWFELDNDSTFYKVNYEEIVLQS